MIQWCGSFEREFLRCSTLQVMHGAASLSTFVSSNTLCRNFLLAINNFKWVLSSPHLFSCILLSWPDISPAPPQPRDRGDSPWECCTHRQSLTTYFGILWHQYFCKQTTMWELVIPFVGLPEVGSITCPLSLPLPLPTGGGTGWPRSPLAPEGTEVLQTEVSQIFFKNNGYKKCF